jgi:hypothetical protein
MASAPEFCQKAGNGQKMNKQRGRLRQNRVLMAFSIRKRFGDNQTLLSLFFYVRFIGLLKNFNSNFTLFKK